MVQTPGPVVSATRPPLPASVEAAPEVEVAPEVEAASEASPLETSSEVGADPRPPAMRPPVEARPAPVNPVADDGFADDDDDDDGLSPAQRFLRKPDDGLERTWKEAR